MKNFPPNPSDGMIFESAPGQYYKFDARSKTWKQLDGYNVALLPATQVESGLMTSEDYDKIQGLLIPPPKTTLFSEDCGYIFDEGIYEFRTTSDLLSIESQLSVIDTDTSGNKFESKEPWKIHRNTYGINFRVNVPHLVQELEKNGKLAYRKTVGPRGKTGPKGQSGIDKLETGPRGPAGSAGKNAPYPGIISKEDVVIESDVPRGIVDITTEEISPTENYLVVVRGNIGDESLCPKLVKPSSIRSKWVLALDERPTTRQDLPNCGFKAGTDCLPSTCAFGTGGVAAFCATKLYYLDLSDIEQIVKTRFNLLMTQLKQLKEEVALEWLKTMVQVFHEQKQSICCAVENCQSRRENDRHRERIEMLRVLAAGPQKGLVIDGDDTRDMVDTNPDKDCPAPGTNPFATNIPDNCAVTPEVDGKENAPTEDDGLLLTLNFGEYELSITGGYLFNSQYYPEVEQKSPERIGKCDINIGLRKNNSQYVPIPLGTKDGGIFAAEAPASLAVYQGFDHPFEGSLRYLRIPVLRVSNGSGAEYSLRAEIVESIEGQPGSTVLASGSVSGTVISKWQYDSIPASGNFGEVIVNFNNAVLQPGPYFLRLRKTGGTGDFFLLSLTRGLVYSDANPFFSTAKYPPAEGDLAQSANLSVYCCLEALPKTNDGGLVSSGITQEEYESMRANPDILVSSSFRDNFDRIKPYLGKVTVNYSGVRDREYVSTPNSERYYTQQEATEANVGQKVKFRHYGGAVKIFFPFSSEEKKATENGGKLELCIVKLDQEPVITRPDSFDCGDFSTSVAVDAATNTFPITPHSFEYQNGAYLPVSIPDPLTASEPVIVTLPAAGVYQLEILDGCFFDVKDVEYDGYLVFGPDYKATLGIPTRILVTKEMYLAAVAGDTSSFIQKWLASESLLDSLVGTAYDFRNTFLRYSELPSTQINIDRIRDLITQDQRPFNAVVTVYYKGYEAGSAELKTLVKRVITVPDERPEFTINAAGQFVYTGTPVQDSERSGYRSEDEAKENFIGRKIQINAYGGEIALFYDNYDPGFGSLVQPQPNPNIGQVSVGITCLGQPPCDATLEVDVDPAINYSEINAVMTELPVGEYIVELVDCCAALSGLPSFYQGRFAVSYLDGGVAETLVSPDYGKFSDQDEARRNYSGSSFGFSHSGGLVKLWAVAPQYSSGLLTLAIIRKECYDECNPPVSGGSTGVTAGDTPTQGSETFVDCDMPAEQVSSYQYAWSSGACCGAYVEVGGTGWIVVMRSLGNDTTCGGGESLYTECIRKATLGGFYPAVAYPSADGELFLGAPTSGFQRFERDLDLEAAIIAKILGGEALKTIGSPNAIDGILFPAEIVGSS